MFRVSKYKEIDERIRWLYFNWWRIKDIAEDVGIPEKTVERRIAAMRKKGIKIERWCK